MQVSAHFPSRKSDEVNAPTRAKNKDRGHVVWLRRPMKEVVSIVITFQKVNPFKFTLFEVVYIKFCHKKIPLPKGKMSIAPRFEYLNYRFEIEFQ